MHVFDNNGIELKAECSIGEEDGVYGLILELWGSGDRNKGYDIAFDYIIERLVDSGISQVVVYLASPSIRKHMHSLDERKIHPGGYFTLIGNSPRDIRLKVCGYQAYFSRTGRKEIPSGNRTKRTLISVSGIYGNSFWASIIRGELSELSQPTDDESLLNMRVSKLIKKTLSQPEGSRKPVEIGGLQKVYVRDPIVKAWILQQSGGIYENCGRNVPFYLNDGNPYLEVHHVIPLSSGNVDTIDNCVALCPNCHRELYYSKNAEELIETLYVNINRLQK